MADFQTALRESIRNFYCQQTSNIEDTLSFAGDTLSRISLVQGRTPLEFFASGVSAARGLVCGLPPQTIPPNSFPDSLANGQCPGTLYRVTGEISFNGGPPVFAGDSTGIGPLRRDKGANDPSGERDIILDANGDFMIGGGTTSAGGTADLTTIQITSLNGPDNCGPGAPLTPSFDGDNFRGPITVNYDDPNGNPQVEIPNITFSPIVIGPGAELNAPFSIDFDDGSSLIGEFNLSIGQINFRLGNLAGDGFDSSPTDLDETLSPEELNLRVCGVRIISAVNITEGNLQEIPGPSESGTIWIPRLGTVAFNYDVQGLGDSWGPDVNVKNTNFVLWADRPAIAVRATPSPGVTFSVIPIVRLTDEPETCGCC